jgi:hypothetical protein
VRIRHRAVNCGLIIDRDHAAARVVLNRALGATGATRLRRDSTADPSLVAMSQVDPLKQENELLAEW